MRIRTFVAVAGVLSAVAAPLVTGAVIENTAAEVVALGADPMLALESNRSAMVERLVAEYRGSLAQSAIPEEAFRYALASLRIDQLLAASLVHTLQEVTAIVAAPPAESPTVSRYVAVAPTRTLASLPAAEAYLVRIGESLRVVKTAQLQLSADTQVVGYFAAAAVSAAGLVAQPKDGAGSGANSWIGYTAGNNIASGSGSAVAAGKFNAAVGVNSFVGAGQSNVASGTSSLVIGGFDNQATAIDSTVVSGAGNRATGARSLVGGGGYNLASGQWSFVGGGGRQTGGGAAGTNPEDNVAAGNFSAVGGGQGNRATGTFAAIPGGHANVASGATSVALGNRAKTQTAGGAPVVHDGAFAFADGSAFDFNTAADNEFAVRATGGVRFVTAIDGAGAPTKIVSVDGGGSVTLPAKLNLPNTASSAIGVMTMGGTRFLHNYGGQSAFVGVNSGNFTTTGTANTGVGYGVLAQGTTGSANTGIGVSALLDTTTGSANTAIGVGSLLWNTAGNGNTGVGYQSLFKNDAGLGNSAIGSGSLFANQSGDGNAAMGANALNSNTTGDGNAALGVFALSANTVGSGNTAIGAQANVAANDLVNATAVGAGAIVDASNHVRVGDTNVTQIGGQVAWTNLSDRRDKKDIRPLSFGLDLVLRLNPVEYRMRNGNDRIDFGFVAQEVEAILGDGYNVLGIGGTAERKLSLRYTDLIAPMIKAIQEQQALIASQQARLDAQQAALASARAIVDEQRSYRAEITELRRAVESLLASGGGGGRLAEAR